MSNKISRSEGGGVRSFQVEFLLYSTAGKAGHVLPPEGTNSLLGTGRTDSLSSKLAQDFW